VENTERGASLGILNAANSLGQAGGPLLGGVLFIWQVNAPYLLSGALLVSLALVIGWKALDRQAEARLA
jgi:MFS transporter, DHA1 family, multidrug resistance protein